MKKIKNFTLIALLTLTMAISLQSCMMTKTQVGNYNQQQGEEYTYAKGKQFWVLWGYIPVGRTSVNTPSSGDCEVITKINVGDALINGLTGGLITSYTIKIKAKR